MTTSCVVETRKTERETRLSEKADSAQYARTLALWSLPPDNPVSSGRSASPVSHENYNAMWYIARIVTILVAGDLCVSITINHNNVRTASIHRIHWVVLML